MILVRFASHPSTPYWSTSLTYPPNLKSVILNTSSPNPCLRTLEKGRPLEHVDLPGATSSQKNDSPSLADIDYQQLLGWEWEPISTSPLHLGTVSGLTSTGPVHAITGSVRSHVQMLGCAWEVLFGSTTSLSSFIMIPKLWEDRGSP